MQIRKYLTSAGLYRGLLYNLVKAGKRSSINLTSIGTWSGASERVIDNVIDYDNNDTIYTSVPNNNFGQWFQVELIDRFIDLKAYAIGYDEAKLYPRHWDIVVSMNGSKWNTPHVIRNNDDSYNGHIFKFNERIGFIRFFKFINRGLNGKNDKGNTAIYLNNIDLYGNTVECKNNCTVFPHIQPTNYQYQTRRANFLSSMLLMIIISR